MKFSELKKCPFCGNDTFYTKRRVIPNSFVIFNEPLNDDISLGEVDNNCMYDNVRLFPNNRCYCSTCDRYLGNKDTNILSKIAEAKLKALKNT